MNSEKYKKLESIIEDKTVRLRESYWINNYSDLYQEVIKYIGLDIPYKIFGCGQDRYVYKR